MKKLITILTPVYNRANALNHLYNSLLSQSVLNFEWLIIDDGSTDNLDDVIASFSTVLFNIKKIKKENGGKHTALNVGISQIETPLTFIVDSDDWLPSNSCEIIENAFYSIVDFKSNICGFSFLRAFSDGTVSGKKFRSNFLIDSYYKIRVLGNDFMCDKAEIFLTKILKEYPFPEFKNEKFLGEDIIWLEMSKKYSMVHINEIVYIGDRVDGGLTANRRNNNIKSCKGSYLRAKTFLEFHLPFKLLVKTILQLQIYGSFSKYSRKKIKDDSNHPFLFYIMWIPSRYIKNKWVRKYGQN